MTPFDARRFRRLGPLGVSPAAFAFDRLFAHVQHFASEYVTLDLEAAISALQPASISSTFENSIVLTAVADFPRPGEWRSPAREIAAITANPGRWHPTNVDFDAMAEFMTRDNAFGTRRHEIVRVRFLGDLLNAMAAQPAGSIGRINIITHAGSGSIPLAGVVRDDGSVSFGVPGDDPPNDVSVIGGTTLGNLKANNSVDSAHPNLAFTPSGGGTIRFRDALKSLYPSWAFIYIYGCNGGFDQTFVQDVADTFGVMVFGFAAEIGYAPDHDGHRIASRLNCRYPGLAGNPFIGLHKLVPDRFAKPLSIR